MRTVNPNRIDQAFQDDMRININRKGAFKLTVDLSHAMRLGKHDWVAIAWRSGAAYPELFIRRSYPTGGWKVNANGRQLIFNSLPLARKICQVWELKLFTQKGMKSINLAVDPRPVISSRNAHYQLLMPADAIDPKNAHMNGISSKFQSMPLTFEGKSYDATGFMNRMRVLRYRSKDSVSQEARERNKEKFMKMREIAKYAGLKDALEINL